MMVGMSCVGLGLGQLMQTRHDRVSQNSVGPQRHRCRAPSSSTFFRPDRRNARRRRAVLGVVHPHPGHPPGRLRRPGDARRACTGGRRRPRGARRPGQRGHPRPARAPGRLGGALDGDTSFLNGADPRLAAAVPRGLQRRHRHGLLGEPRCRDGRVLAELLPQGVPRCARPPRSRKRQTRGPPGRRPRWRPGSGQRRPGRPSRQGRQASRQRDWQRSRAEQAAAPLRGGLALGTKVGELPRGVRRSAEVRRARGELRGRYAAARGVPLAAGTTRAIAVDGCATACRPAGALPAPSLQRPAPATGTLARSPLLRAPSRSLRSSVAHPRM